MRQKYERSLKEIRRFEEEKAKNDHSVEQKKRLADIDKELLIGILETVLNVMIPVVAALGAIFCVFLGVKYSRAEEPQEREKAKSHLKAAIIGFVLVFVLIVALRIATPLMTDWMNNNS